MRIEFYSHYFKVIRPNEVVRRSINSVAIRHLMTAERDYVDGKWVINKETIEFFAFNPPDKSYIRFHINFYPVLLEQFNLDGISLSDFELVNKEMTPDQVYPVEFIRKPNDDEDREYQDKINKNLHAPGSNKVINLQPGAGKTKITMNFAAEFGCRVQAVMSAKYLDQWAKEIEDYFETKRSDIVIVQGGESLRALMQMHLDGELEAKVILVSIETFSIYLKNVEQGLVTDDYYPIHPDEYFTSLGIGLHVIDEGHQNPHRVCRLFCHMNVVKSITLSATLNTKNVFLNNVFKMMYPMEIRDTGGYKNVYIGAKCVSYRMKRPGRIRSSGYKGSYSHLTFEESILRAANRSELNNYMEMLKYYVRTEYVETRNKDQKAIIFFSTKKMCTYARSYFEKAFPFLKVVRYIGEDNRKVMDDADLIVSTVLSAGTAVDIKNLIVNYLTINIDSQISNEQTLGRTRPVKNEPDRTPIFMWFQCKDIDKHVKYTRNKKEFLKDKVKYIEDLDSPIQV